MSERQDPNEPLIEEAEIAIQRSRGVSGHMEDCIFDHVFYVGGLAVLMSAP